jgi:hypothetical protein
VVLGSQNNRILPAPLTVFLFDGVGGAQSILPGLLERARHQAILGLDRVILTTRALSFIAGALPSQRPLLFELPSFVGHTIHGGYRNLDLIGRKRLQQNAADQIVHRQRPDFLA